MAAQYAYLEATAQIKVGAGKLKSIFVSSGTAPTIAVYNTATASTSGATMVATFTGATPGIYQFTGDEGGVWFDEGLYVVVGGTNPKVTVTYE
jgi:Neuraminidase (sialidase)